MKINPVYLVYPCSWFCFSCSACIRDKHQTGTDTRGLKEQVDGACSTLADRLRPCTPILAFPLKRGKGSHPERLGVTELGWIAWDTGAKV
jgi:hypothetical protein